MGVPHALRHAGDCRHADVHVAASRARTASASQPTVALSLALRESRARDSGRSAACADLEGNGRRRARPRESRGRERRLSAARGQGRDRDVSPLPRSLSVGATPERVFPGRVADGRIAPVRVGPGAHRLPWGLQLSRLHDDGRSLRAARDCAAALRARRPRRETETGPARGCLDHRRCLHRHASIYRGSPHGDLRHLRSHSAICSPRHGRRTTCPRLCRSDRSTACTSWRYSR